MKDGVPGMLEGTEKNRMLFRKYRMLAEKGHLWRKNVL